MLFSAIDQNGKLSLHGSETKTYFPAAINTSQNCSPQKIVNGESVKLIRRSISGRNSISNSKTAAASSLQKNTTSIKKEMDVNGSPLVKTLSGRIKIGTEYLKETAQKVFNVANNDNTDKNCIHLKSSTNLSPKNISKVSLNLHHANVNSGLKNDSKAYKQPLHLKENCEKRNTIAKGFTLPPSIFHRQVEAYRTDECSSVDNFNKEMCHFRPIRLAPISPWKSGINLPRRGVIVVPKTIMAKTSNVAGDHAFASIMNEELCTRHSLFSPPHKSAFVNTKTVHHIEVKERKPARPKKSVNKSTRKTRRTKNQALKSITAEETESTIKQKLRSRDPKMANKKFKSPTLMTEKVLKINHGTTQRGQKRSLNALVLNEKKKKKKKQSSQNIGQPSCSPPLTRSRLREMGKSNLTNALQYIGRYI